VRELDETLTEVTARAGRAGHLPVAAAVRARGEQRRRRQHAGATVLSVAVLTGLAAGLLNGNVLGSAEPAPQLPAHSSTPTPTPTPAPVPSTPAPKPSTAAQPAVTTRPSWQPDKDEQRKLLEQKVQESRSQLAENERAAEERAEADKKAELLKRLSARTSTTTTSRR
jgi:outer membrane biosynthesis protein TonB